MVEPSEQMEQAPVDESEPASRGLLLPVLKLVLAIGLIVGVIWVLEGGRLGDTADSATTSPLSGRGGGVTPRVGEPAPSFSLSTPSGQRLALADLRGQAVLLNFWASWCPPCRGEMPDLENLAREYRASGLVLVGVNLEEEGPTVQRYADMLGLSFPLALDQDGEVANRYNLTALPTSYFIDRDGVVRDLNIGALTEKGLRSKLARVL
jgi:cytochrome c biogenesis protein CcmG, thiol:disulfide interchange protein DsbE